MTELPAPSTPGLGVVLVRHGQTDDNVPPLRFQGRTDTPMNETGRAEIRSLAETAEPGYAALYCSDLGRARESAAILGGRLGLEPAVDDRWSESSRGRWEGRPMDEVTASEPDLWEAWRAAGPEFRFPEGESLAEHAERARAALAEALAGPLPALVVCHGGTIRVLLEPDLTRFHELTLPNACAIPLDVAGRPLEPSLRR